MSRPPSSQALADVAQAAFLVDLGDLRAHVGRLDPRITPRDFGAGFGGHREGVLVVLPGEQHAGEVHAALTRVAAHAEHAGLDHGGDVGVVEDDAGRLAAELEEQLLDVLGGGGHDPPADGGRAGEGDHVDAGVGDHVLAHRRVRGGDDVEDAGGQVGFLVGDPAHQGGGPRRPRGGLDDHGVAGGQGRADLRAELLDRVVVRRDDGDHAPGLLDDQAPVGLDPAPVEVGHVVVELVVGGLVGLALQVADGDVELDHGRPGHEHGGADLGHQQLPQLLDVALHGLHELGDAAAPELVVLGPLGLVEGGAGGGDGRVDVGDVGVRRGPDHRLEIGVDVVERLARRGARPAGR